VPSLLAVIELAVEANIIAEMEVGAEFVALLVKLV
jgi:hypothetical protein